MKDLKELLFERTYNAWKGKNDVFAYHLSALYALIIEAGLDNEFQEWKKNKEENADE
jgi:hypothetical protein